MSTKSQSIYDVVFGLLRAYYRGGAHSSARLSSAVLILNAYDDSYDTAERSCCDV